TEEDIARLTEIRIKRISKFDLDKAQQYIDSLEDKIAQTKNNLTNLIDFAISYFKELKSKYGKGRERKSEIRIFDDIIATKVVIRNTKLYVNREEGFIGTSLKRDEYVTDCSDIDDIIVFTKSGHMMITKVDSKTFIGKNIIHVAVFKKKDQRMTYNMIYKDGRGGSSYVKRFNVTSITRDKLYDLTAGKNSSDISYFSANPNGEAEIVTIFLRQVGNIKKLKWDLDFADVMIKGRGSKGNIVTKYSVKKIELKEKGLSTLKPRKLWFDDTVQRLNVDNRGELMGEFTSEDRLLIVNQKGILKVVIPELTMRFDDDIIVLEKWIPNKPISVIYWEGSKELFYLKRFLVENPDKEDKIITDHPKSYLEKVFTDYRPMAELVYAKKRGMDRKENQVINIEEFISIKGSSAMGNQLTKDKVLEINALEPLLYEVPEVPETLDIEVVDEENILPESKGLNTKPKKESNQVNPKEAPNKNDEEGQTTLF
ncbi:MAG: DNA gyrase/topoisomerase IV subunit A, partial [Eudoraea sp.]|nr:DNA gyrase/topoisomerase IV subunit A [Eudoraea sp.]